MADAAGLNPAAERRGGSNPSSGTTSACVGLDVSTCLFAGRILPGLRDARISEI
jgi:hypothetical protein